MKLVFCVRICYALRTSAGFNVLGPVEISSTLKLYLPSSSFAVFQFNYLYPLSAQTICIVFSIIGWGLDIALSSIKDALLIASIESAISALESARSC